MSHDHHHHHDASEIGEKRLFWAVVVNVALTLAQVIGGLVSGSLSLIADALHNLSDAASIFIALMAIRIGRKPPDSLKTFGYKRSETIAALINLTALVLIGLFLIIEAAQRFFTPEPITGWIVVIVASFALIIDVVTSLLTYAQSKHSMNIKAVFLHNLTDAMASVGVILSGTLVLLYGWVWVDAVVTLLIAAYMLWHGVLGLPQVIHLLMEGTPQHINIDDVIAAMEAHQGVDNVHHVHIWQLDEHRNALEAHVVLSNNHPMDAVKVELKHLLKHKFSIGHSTLEFETNHCDHC